MLLNLEHPVVASRCPLLAAEKAPDFLPQVCMPVPRNSAWVPLELDLLHYTNNDGQIREAELIVAMHNLVDEGDRLHDQIEWSAPVIEYDSWLNRRLAIAVRGLGDIVSKRDADPGSLDVLRDMEQLAQWVCETVHQRSRSLAAGSNWCPALDKAGALVLEKGRSTRWRRRWRKAVQSVAVRHRNLTTMSPWDVFPRGKPADLRYADLLPLLRFADSLSFQCDASIRRWNANEFNSFRERVSAIARTGRGAGLVAEQV